LADQLEGQAENLVALAEELNLGLDSFVFLDDSPQERDQIRQVLVRFMFQIFLHLPPSLRRFSHRLTASKHRA